MLAFGATAPLGSVTWPTMRPVSTWAKAGATLARTHHNKGTAESLISPDFANPTITAALQSGEGLRHVGVTQTITERGELRGSKSCRHCDDMTTLMAKDDRPQNHQ